VAEPVANRWLATTGPLTLCPRNPPVAHWWQTTDGPLVASHWSGGKALVCYQWLSFVKMFSNCIAKHINQNKFELIIPSYPNI